MSDDLVDGMCELFRGRLDAYGTDYGGCDKVTDEVLGVIGGTEEEYRRRMSNHLAGTEPFGIYPRVELTPSDLDRSNPGAYVRWGCTDLDYTDNPAAAKNIARTLHHFGINAWVETSRSKGFHVWTFSYEWVPAETMRNALLAVHQILDIRPTEVNPKSVHGGATGIGNYVRIPYPGYLAGDRGDFRQTVQDLAVFKPLPLDVFVEAAISKRSSNLQYQKLASRYVPPAPKSNVAIGAVLADMKSITTKLNKEGFFAFEYGPRDGHDRSDSLARLAHNCRESNLTPSEAYAIVQDADARWGKFSERPDCEEQLEKLVRNAYG